MRSVELVSPPRLVWKNTRMERNREWTGQYTFSPAVSLTPVSELESSERDAMLQDVLFRSKDVRRNHLGGWVYTPNHCSLPAAVPPYTTEFSCFRPFYQEMMRWFSIQITGEEGRYTADIVTPNKVLYRGHGNSQALALYGALLTALEDGWRVDGPLARLQSRWAATRLGEATETAPDGWREAQADTAPVEGACGE